MRSKLALATAFVLLAGLAQAITETATRAFVVSVDAKTKSITLRHKPTGSATFKELVVVWDDKTEWGRSDKEIWDTKPATVDLVKDLKKDTKVYAGFSDEPGGGKWRLLKLRTIPPGETVD